MVKRSRYPFTETVARLRAAIQDAGATVFATIEAGLILRPTTLIIFGNPKAGTALMDAFPLAALDLPLKFLVWEDEGAVSVAYVTATEIAARYGVSGKDALIAALDGGLSMLSDSVADRLKTEAQALG